MWAREASRRCDWFPEQTDVHAALAPGGVGRCAGPDAEKFVFTTLKTSTELQRHLKSKDEGGGFAHHVQAPYWVPFEGQAFLSGNWASKDGKFCGSLLQ